MFSRFLAKNVGSASSFRSHFQQIESADPNLWLLSCLAVQNQNRWLTPIPTSNVHLKYGCRHLPWSSYKSVFVEVYAGPTCKTDFSQIHEESSVELLGWYGVPFPSSCCFPWLESGEPHLWRSCKTAVQSWWKKGVKDCTNQWIVSRIRGPRDHLLLTRMNSLPNSSKKISGVFDFETLTTISNQVIVLWVWQVHATYHPCFPYHFCPRLEKKTSFGGLRGVTFRGTMSLNRKQG